MPSVAPIMAPINLQLIVVLDILTSRDYSNAFVIWVICCVYRGEKAAPSVTQVAWINVIYSWIDVLGLLESVITIYLVLIEFLRCCRRRTTSHRTNGLCSLSFTQRCWSASLSSQSQVCGFSATRSANSYHQSDSTIRLFYTPMLPYQFSQGWCRYTILFRKYSREKVYCRCITI